MISLKFYIALLQLHFRTFQIWDKLWRVPETSWSHRFLKLWRILHLIFLNINFLSGWSGAEVFRVPIPMATSGEQSTKFYKGKREAPPRMTSFPVSGGGQECEGISHQSFSVCNAVLTNHNYGETAVNGYLLTQTTHRSGVYIHIFRSSLQIFERIKTCTSPPFVYTVSAEPCKVFSGKH